MKGEDGRILEDYTPVNLVCIVANNNSNEAKSEDQHPRLSSDLHMHDVVACTPPINTYRNVHIHTTTQRKRKTDRCK